MSASSHSLSTICDFSTSVVKSLSSNSCRSLAGTVHAPMGTLDVSFPNWGRLSSCRTTDFGPRSNPFKRYHPTFRLKWKHVFWQLELQYDLNRKKIIGWLVESPFLVCSGSSHRHESPTMLALLLGRWRRRLKKFSHTALWTSDYLPPSLDSSQVGCGWRFK